MFVCVICVHTDAYHRRHMKAKELWRTRENLRIEFESSGWCGKDIDPVSHLLCLVRGLKFNRVTHVVAFQSDVKHI